MTREELRYQLLSDIDRALTHTWVLSQNDQKLLRAVRQVIVTDDSVVDKVNQALLTVKDEEPTSKVPYEGEE